MNEIGRFKRAEPANVPDLLCDALKDRILPKMLDLVAVRYHWADNSGKVNVYNIKGLSASIFKTSR